MDIGPACSEAFGVPGGERRAGCRRAAGSGGEGYVFARLGSRRAVICADRVARTRIRGGLPRQWFTVDPRQWFTVDVPGGGVLVLSVAVRRVARLRVSE